MRPYYCILLLALAKSARSDLYPVGYNLDDGLPENALMANERQTIDDCHMRFYSEGGRGLVGPAFAKPAFLREFAHIGAIGWTGLNGTVNWGCGGSLIWNNFIVTAAHCTANDDNVAPDVVRFGDLNLYSDEDDDHAQQLRIVNIVRHPLYKFNAKYYDIALMQLERNITVHETVAPACLWLDEEVRFTVLESAGWGQTGFGHSQTPILLKITLEPISNEDCSEHYTPTVVRGLRNGLQQHHLCAGDEKMDTCLGDSGGPLHVRLQHNSVVTPFLVGLTSFGLPCGQSKPGVYTRISSFRSWILESLRENGAPEATDGLFEPQECAIRHAGIRQLAISKVVANESGVFETFDINRQYITSSFVHEVVQLKWPESVAPAKNDCTGSIIDRDTVVTLGDCASHAGIPPTQVLHRKRTGYERMDYIDQEYNVTAIYVHPNHTVGSYYDNIAVLKIEGSLMRLPACIWVEPTLLNRELEIAAVGRVDLNVYQYKGKPVYDASSMRLSARGFSYDNDKCKLARQYRQKLDRGLLEQHLCFANDPFLVPQVCDLTNGGPLQRSVNRLGRFFKYVYGLSLFGRDCGFGEPAVAVWLRSHLAWMESVLLPNRTSKSTTSTMDSVLIVNPDLELFDRCEFHNETVGLCVPVERCRGIQGRLKRKEGLIFCTNGTVVCCRPVDVMDDEDFYSQAQQIEDCENRYESLRRRNALGPADKLYSKPHIAEVISMNERDDRVTRLCLGYLIATGTVVTSAVCTQVRDFFPNFVRLGFIPSQYDDLAILAPVKNVTVHLEFNSRTGVNNIALLKLFNPIEPTAALFPGCLWQNETHTPLVTSLLSIVDDQVKEEMVHPQYVSDCERSLGVPPHDGQLCMVPTDNIPCPVTSNPVTWRQNRPSGPPIDYLVGLYTHGGCGSDSETLVNTRISAYFAWIVENV